MSQSPATAESRPGVSALLDRMSSGPRLVRSGAFHELLSQLWGENPEKPGQGLVCVPAPERSAVFSDLLNAALGAEPGAAAPAILILTLLYEAERDAGEAPPQVAAALDAFLSRLEKSVRAAREEPAGRQLIEPLLYLLGQFPDASEEVVSRVTEIFGEESGAVEALGRIYQAPAEQAALARATLAYLGAGAMARHALNRRVAAESVLACPVCHGRLTCGVEQIDCEGCGARFNWLGDSPELVPEELSEPDQFPERMVEIYEEKYRPRFVQLMARDWPASRSGQRGATFDQEQAYLQANFRPLDGPVLDLACGAGGWTRILAGIVGEERIVALDYSVAMVAACARRLPGSLTVRGSASCLPIQDGVLGGANCSDALQALPDPRTAIMEIGRCLAPGAPLTCFTFRESPTPYRYFQHRFPIHPRQLFREDDLRRWCHEAGLTVTDFRVHGDAIFMAASRNG